MQENDSCGTALTAQKKLKKCVPHLNLKINKQIQKVTLIHAFKSFQVSFAKQKTTVQDMPTKNYRVCASFIKVSLMKVTYGWEHFSPYFTHLPSDMGKI